MTENEIYAKLTEFVKEKVDIDSLEPSSNLSDLGLDSLDKADIVIQVEDAFNIYFNDDEIIQITTVEDFVKAIEALLANK